MLANSQQGRLAGIHLRRRTTGSEGRQAPLTGGDNLSTEAHPQLIHEMAGLDAKPSAADVLGQLKRVA